MSVPGAWWGLGLAMALSGCHPSKDEVSDTDVAADTDVDTDVVEAPTVASFCADMSAAICAGMEACGCRFDVRPYSAATCVASRTDDCVAGLGGHIQADLDAGRAALDAPHVTACIEAIRALGTTCTLPTSGVLPDVCNAIVVDVAAVGEECTVQGGGMAFCGGGDGLCVPGESSTKCLARPGDGEDCLQGECGEGLVCGNVSAKCAPPGDVGAACFQAADCASPLVCGADAKCVAPFAVGARCTGSEQCDEGLRCDGGTCAQAVMLGEGCYDPGECGALRSCGRAPERRTCGDADTLEQPCRSGTCADGLECAASSLTCATLPGEDELCLDGFACGEGLTCADGLGVCAVLPGVGETCASGNRFCEDGLGCDFDTNTCQPGPGEGEVCLLNPPDYVCGDGLGCDFGRDGSVCIPLGGAGSACNSDRTCAPDTFCDFGTLLCADRLADGVVCTDGNECAVGSTCALQPGGYVCAPIPAHGDACTDVCEEGSVCKGPGGECVPTLCVIP